MRFPLFLLTFAYYLNFMFFRDTKDYFAEKIDESALLSFLFNVKHLVIGFIALIFLSLFGWFLSTRPNVVSASVPGKLQTFYNLKEWSKMKRLTIEGNIDNSDVAFLSLYASSLELLDLSGANLQSIPDSAFANSSCLEQVVLPETMVSIGKSAFAGCPNLSSVVLPPRLVEIGENAFNGTAISSFHIPPTLKRIGAGAFASTKLSELMVADGNCSFKVIDNVLFNADTTTLVQYPAMKVGEEFTVPASVRLVMSYAFSGVRTLTRLSLGAECVTWGDGVFKNCSALGSFSFPNGVDTVPAGFFEGCVSLYSVSFSPRLRVVSDYAFWNCPNLKDIRLPKTVSYVGDFAFAYCKSLEGVDVSSVENMGKFAFAYCVGLKSISLSNSLRCIGESAFCNCENLSKMVVPSSVRQIGDNAFSGCLSLSELKLDEGLQVIGAMAFAGCSCLNSIELPSSLTSIYGDCFYGCSQLSAVSVYASMPPECKNDFPVTVANNCVLYAPYQSIPRYQFEDGWNKFFRVQSLNKSK